VGNAKRLQRESKVGNKRSGASATSKNTVEGGGSSNTLSNALPEIIVSASAG
jgi:hypothetical protein